MQKIASNLIRQAKALANIDNTNSFAFSELFDYINAAYREVYVSMIEAGDMTYVKELNVSGSGEFTLPDDFFQLAYIRTASTYGQGLDLERDYDYQIRNGCIRLNGYSSVLMGYYPKPELITFKAQAKEITLDSFVPISAWETMVIDSSARIYDFREESNVKTTESSGSYILGSNTYLNTSTKTVYDFSGNVDSTYTTPILRTDGTFNEDIYNTGHALGWSNEDGSIEFTVNNGSLYYTDEEDTVLIAENYTPGLNARVVFLDGEFVLVDLKRITWKDGSWETTDVSKSKVICKASLESGYGYISKDGNKYFLQGWMPETKIDFPNNIFFDMLAYDMAIQMRRKLNMDTSDLIEGYNDRKGQYVMTLSSDGANFPTVRNTRSPFGHFSF